MGTPVASFIMAHSLAKFACLCCILGGSALTLQHNGGKQGVQIAIEGTPSVNSTNATKNITQDTLAKEKQPVPAKPPVAVPATQTKTKKEKKEKDESWSYEEEKKDKKKLLKSITKLTNAIKALTEKQERLITIN